MSGQARPRLRKRIAWFAHLESIVDRPDLRTLLAELRDEMGLTTLVPESHLTHTSGFAADPSLIGPLDDWAQQPGLAIHRREFGVPAPARPVLPGIIKGWDDSGLLRLIDAARSVDLEVWGHAGLWCYGGEVFPDLAARDIFGRPLPEGTAQWGTMFCPSKPILNDWIAESLADAARTYDLDGWFLDHARYTSPGHGPSLLACGCEDCEFAASDLGVDLQVCRDGVKRLMSDLMAMSPSQLATLSVWGRPLDAWFAGYEGVLDWFRFRADLLADRFAGIAEAVQTAAPRPVEFGSDVFPPSVALFGGHIYEFWARSATYFTGGFTPRIAWGSVAGVTARYLAPCLQAGVRNLETQLAEQIIGGVIGLTTDEVSVEREGWSMPALVREIRAIAAQAAGTPVYVPIPAGLDAVGLRLVCSEIVAAGLDGAMMVDIDKLTSEQRAIVGSELSARLG